MKNILSEDRIKKSVSLFLLFCIIVGMALHIVPFVFNRSLWTDEAMLASSICNRTISELVSSPLDFGQSSAIGWLFIVKVITVVFGESETALRVWSLISSFGCTLLVYLLLHKKTKRNYALFITAIFSLTDRFIYYGNEVKPYMFDNLLCLLTLLIWQKYKDKKVALWKMVIAYSVIIWFSFSAVFFIAACMIIECIKLMRDFVCEKNRQSFYSICCCSLVLVSFVLNYIFWLSGTSSNAGGAEYWELLRFPLIPTSLSDIKLILKMGLQFFSFFPKFVVVVFIIIFVLYILMCVIKKNDPSNLLLPFGISLLILFVASYLGFYPIQDRLVQVYQLIVFVIAGFGGNGIIIKLKTDNNEVNWLGLFYYGILISCLAYVGMGGCKNMFAWHVYKAGSEVSESIKYLDQNLTDDDVLYVFRSSIPVYQYETGEVECTQWTDMPDVPYIIGNKIYGQSLISYYYSVPYSYDYEEDVVNVREDADAIIKNDSVYIFTSHGGFGIPWLLDEIEKYGVVEMVVDSYDTHLYHFVKE